MTPGWKKPALVGAGAALFVGILGGLTTDLGPWYFSLAVPPWKPPDWAFGPAWTLIYACTTWSGVSAWRHAPDERRRGNWLVLLSLNAFLNVMWSLLFFRLKHPDWAVAEVVFLWASVASLVVYPWRWDRRASLLNLPYLVWVTFASALNIAIVRLNGPFL